MICTQPPRRHGAPKSITQCPHRGPGQVFRCSAGSRPTHHALSYITALSIIYTRNSCQPSCSLVREGRHSSPKSPSPPCPHQLTGCPLGPGGPGGPCRNTKACIFFFPPRTQMTSAWRPWEKHRLSSSNSMVRASPHLSWWDEKPGGRPGHRPWNVLLSVHSCSWFACVCLGL